MNCESLTLIMNAVLELDPRQMIPSTVDEEDQPTSFDAEIQPASDVQAKIESHAGRWLRYKVDRRAVAYVSLSLAVHVAIFFLASTWVALLCVVPLAVASMFVAATNHHHQHFATFHSAWLNRIFEIALSLQTGIAPFAWVLHHNLGHHVNYLSQPPHAKPDESKWTRRDGSQMGRIEYTIDLLLHHQIDIVRVGRRYPKYFRIFLWMKLPLWMVIGTALYLNPVNALLVILLPGFLTLAHTSWVTYEHHAGVYPTNHYDASRNNTNALFNYITCNLGYHTAHHKRPGVHWSLLPEIHDEIKHRIPANLIQTAFW